MMNYRKEFLILAKSDAGIPLQKHIDDCIAIWKQLKESFPNLPLRDKELFWEVLKVCIIFHDTGKCHKEFQKLLRGLKNEWNKQRHELFSIHFILQSNLDVRIKKMVCYAVIGHHQSLGQLNEFVYRNYPLNVNANWSFFRERDYKVECGKLCKNKMWKLLKCYGYILECEEIDIDITRLVQKEYKSQLKLSDPDYIFYLLLVGFLKQCDHLASSGINKIHNLYSDDFSFLYENTLFKSLYLHQEIASHTIGNTILSAPTGTGKTEAVLLWLKKQFEVKGQGRVFYVLPYTASINAMYERLNKDFGIDNHKIGLLHGKLHHYIEDRMNSDTSVDHIGKGQLLDDFKTLITPFKVVTPFQLLKCIFGLKGFEKRISEWAGGYFIFDEIHAYDSKTFAQIIVLLKFCVEYLNVNVFIMSATIPSFQRKLLEDSIGKHVNILADKKLCDEFTRHRISLLEGRLEDSLELIQKEINAGKKVLVVCNTVEQAQHVYKKLKLGSRSKKLLLHGAFNAKDRNVKEWDLLNTDVKLLVGTQSLEVSLDIDYDVIYTEPAPLDALIQRFGRINRKHSASICLCYVFQERNEKDKFIYDSNVINRTLKVLRDILQQSDGVIFESNIQMFMDQVYQKWEGNQLDDYELTLSTLSTFVTKSLSPLTYDEKSEELFYKQFDGIKVLPVDLVEDYQRLISQKLFIKADGLLVSIRESRLFGLLKEKGIYKDSFYFENTKSDISSYKTVYVIKRAYDPEIGLQIDCVRD